MEEDGVVIGHLHTETQVKNDRALRAPGNDERYVDGGVPRRLNPSRQCIDERTNAGHGLWTGRHRDASGQAVDGNAITSKRTGLRRVLARLADATDSKH